MIEAVIVRPYQDEDYPAVKELYSHSEWYGGDFDESRDGRELLRAEVEHDPESILVAESDIAIVGTISLILTSRLAMLYRFAVRDNDDEVLESLYQTAKDIVSDRGYTRLDVYAPANNARLSDKRYEAFGMQQGSTYRFYWTDLPS